MKVLCQRCGSSKVRMGVNLFLDAPTRFYARLSKSNLRAKDVQVMGAGWDRAYFYCSLPKCGWNTHLSEIDRLRGELAAALKAKPEGG